MVCNLEKLRDKARSLIEELGKAQAPNTFPEIEEGKPRIPGFVAAGNGRSLMLTQAMEELIEQIGLVLKQNHPSANGSHTDREWNDLVRTQLGPILATIDLTNDMDDNAKIVLDSLRNGLKNTTIKEPREYAFGCTLFGNDVPEFGFGPVRFETRNEWLNRKEEDGNITKDTARRVRHIWSGEAISERKEGIESIYERDILDSIGRTNYVCSVTVSGLGSEAGELKAQTAARLALTAIALTWTLPSSALEGFNLLIDRTVRLKKILSFVVGKITLASTSLKGRPHGPTISAADWADTLATHKGFFNTVGELTEFYLSSTEVNRPKLMNTFVQALYWFHEGCREEVDLAAIVNFAATLDALAGGGESAGILALIEARLGQGAASTFRPNGQTTRQAVEELYGKGRSRTIHGTNDKFGHDWGSTRRFGEAVARLCLLTCFELASTGISDDTDLLKRS